MTNKKEQAVAKFLAEPKITYGDGGCCCMGKQKINGFDKKEYTYIVTIKDVSQRAKFILFVHKEITNSLSEAKEKVDLNKVGFDNIYSCNFFQKNLQNLNIETEITENPSGLNPECPCAMRNVMEVEGDFYKVIENRSADEITHEAVFLGHIGGPYVCI